MSLNDRFHIGWVNDLEDMTLSATVSEKSGFEIENIVNGTSGLPAKFRMLTPFDNPVMSLTILATSATERIGSGLLLSGGNWDGDVAAYWDLYSGENQSGSSVTIGPVDAYTVIPFGDTIPGYTPWGSHYDPTLRFRKTIFLQADHVPYKSMRIRLVTSGVWPNDEAVVDKAYAASLWSPKENFTWNYPMGIVQPVSHRRMGGGGFNTVNHSPVANRRLELTFRDAPRTDRDVLAWILNSVGMEKDLLIVGSPNQVGWERINSVFIGRRMEDWFSTTIGADLNEHSVIFEES